MGPHMMKRPPKFVHGFTDRHGKARYYFRRAGFTKAALPGLPWSPEFMAAYEAAMNGDTAPRIEIGVSRTKPGTINAAVVGYFNSTAFLSLKASTQTTYRGILQNFRAEHGDKRIALLERRHIDNLIAKKAATPAAANNLLRMLRTLMQFAVAQDMRRDDPTVAIKGVTVRSEGFHTWTEEEIAAFEARHPLGTRARLAFGLLLFTAQRRGDVVGMGRQHLRNGVLHVRQQKTGMALQIPLHPELQVILDATPNDHLTFLITDFGKPFAAAGFGNWFRSMCNEAGLKGCSAHGLRKAASRRLAEHGCTAHEIMSITGHKTLKEVTRYTMAADRTRLAVTAMQKSTTGTSSGKPGRKSLPKRL